MSLLVSILLSFANPSPNWTIQDFARVAETEKTQRKKQQQNSLGFQPLSTANRADVLPTEQWHQLAEHEC